MRVYLLVACSGGHYKTAPGYVPGGHTVVSLEQGRCVSEERVVGVVGGGFLYLSPLGVYNTHVSKLLYPGAVL